MRRKKTPEKPSEPAPPCAVPGCPNPGEYKAPRSRYQTGLYQFLCLDHIREFNRAWDYFDGWSREDIESYMHNASHGHKPTWKIGTGPVFTNEKLRESFFRMLGEETPKRRAEPKIPRKIREALAALDLEPGAEPLLIKSQYKKLVKKYHPDVNKGAKSAEEAFKHITAAYSLLMKTYGKTNENQE